MNNYSPELVICIMPTTLHIKNMVCNRCIKVVQDELSALGYSIKNIELGELTLKEDISDLKMDKISKSLAGTSEGIPRVDTMA